MFKPSLRLLLTAFSLFVSSLVFAQQYTLSGQVLNQDQQGLGNVSIQILNSNAAILSDDKGNFILGELRPGTYVLRFSSVGYASQNKEIALDGSKSLSVIMNRSSSQLDDALVTAPKHEIDPQSIPGSLTLLGAKDIQNHYVWNIMDAAAMAPNLYLANPGDGRNISSIRGITTSSYNPAVATYVDGVGQFSLDT
jgi:iron complex outermembrane receptor protein